MRPHVFVKVITIFAYQCFQSIDDWKGFFFLCDLLSALLAKVSDLDWNEMFSNEMNENCFLRLRSFVETSAVFFLLLFPGQHEFYFWILLVKSYERSRAHSFH